jgi:hypothetical protein
MVAPSLGINMVLATIYLLNMGNVRSIKRG